MSDSTTELTLLVEEIEQGAWRASLFDPAEGPDSMPVAEAEGDTADGAVLNLINRVTFAPPD